MTLGLTTLSVLALVACGNVTGKDSEAEIDGVIISNTNQNDGDTETVEVDEARSEEAYQALFDDLKTLKDIAVTASTSDEIMSQAQGKVDQDNIPLQIFSTLSSDYASLGYTLVDINEDGQEELILAAAGSEGPAPMAIYYLKDNHPTLVAQAAVYGSTRMAMAVFSDHTIGQASWLPGNGEGASSTF